MTAPAAPDTEPTFSAADLAARTVQRRAVEAVIWGIPAVNFELMFQSHVRDAKGVINQISYWSRFPNWKNQTLTPNPDTIYFMPFFSTKDVGPLVLEIPPADEGSITGTIMNCWQEALEDVGPAGMDKGKGGKYLITPPGFRDKAPDGYLHLPSNNYQGYALLRSILKSRSEADIARAVAYGKRIKLYPLARAANPPQTTFVDAVDVVFDGVIPYDVRFFQSLDRVVQTEPWLERDRAMIDMLKSIGIETGQAVQAGLQDHRGVRVSGRRGEGVVRCPLRDGLPALQQRTALVPASGRQLRQGRGDGLHADRHLSDRRTRDPLLLRLHQREAPRRGPVLPVRHPRQGRQPAGRCRHLSPSCPAPSPREAVLVRRPV